MSAPGFNAHVTARLVLGATEYENTSYDRPVGELLGEILEEAADIAAWARIAGTVLARDTSLPPADRARVARALRVATADAERAWNRLRAAQQTIEDIDYLESSST